MMESKIYESIKRFGVVNFLGLYALGILIMCALSLSLCFLFGESMCFIVDDRHIHFN